MRRSCYALAVISISALSGCQNNSTLPVAPSVPQPVKVIIPSEGVTITPYQPDEIKRQKL